MNEARFTKSLARWSFIEAIDLEVCSHMHADSVFLLSENLGRIAKMSCPPELDKTSSRCAQGFDTNFVFQDAFEGFEVKGREMELLQIVQVLGRGSLNAGTLVCQVFHWFYVGAPRATTSYEACINVLLSTKQLHLRHLKSMIETHGNDTVFARCTFRSEREAKLNYILVEDDFKVIKEKLSIKTA